MKLTTLITFTILLPFLSSAQLFEEHLSHDRISLENIGHFWGQGELFLVMKNSTNTTIEKITSNEAKTIFFESEYHYSHSTFITGTDDKTINLYKPWSYDINGFGGVSIRVQDEHFSMTSQVGNQPDALINCHDVSIPYGSPTSECIDENGDIQIFDSSHQLIETKEGLGPLNYYVGHNEAEMAVKNGQLGDFYNYAFVPRVNISGIDAIFNNPFTQGYEMLTGNERKSYNANFDIISNFTFEDKPIAIDIKNEAIYYLLKDGNGYSIHKNFSEGGTSLLATIDPTPNGQEFEILDIEVRGLNIFLFGLHTDPKTNVSNHMVRRINILDSTAPVRRNASITNFEVTQTLLDDSEYYRYEYTIDVENKGANVINSFDIYSDLSNFNGLSYTNIAERYEGELLPGESMTITGFFEAYSLAKLNINIPGSNYMLDALPNDNSAEFIFTTATKDINQDMTYDLYPNPSSNFLTLKNSKNENFSLIGIYDSQAKNMNLSIHNSIIDISELIPGRYFIRLEEDKTLKVLSFIKI